MYLVGSEVENTLLSAIRCRGTGDAFQELMNILVSRATEQDVKTLASCLRESVR